MVNDHGQFWSAVPGGQSQIGEVAAERPETPAGTLRGEQPRGEQPRSPRQQRRATSILAKSTSAALDNDPKAMIHRVREMASPLRLVTAYEARAGCAHEEVLANKPANYGPGGGLG